LEKDNQMKTRIASSRWAAAAGLFLFGASALGANALQIVSLRDPSQLAVPGGNGDSEGVFMSPDGRYVVFASAADDLVLPVNAGPVPAPLPTRINVFLRDRTNATTTLVSVNASATGGGNRDSFPTGLSTNGQYVLFESAASNLVAGNSNCFSSVFVRNMANGVTVLASAPVSGTSINGSSRSSVFTPDGRYVAFVSEASNVVTWDTNGIADVFVRDLQAGTTVLASVGACSTNPTVVSSGSDCPRLSSNGRYVAFWSSATNLVSGVTTAGELYVRDLTTGTTQCASANARGLFQSLFGTTDAVSYNPALSADGRYLAFETSSNVPPSNTGLGVVQRFDLQTGQSQLVCTNAVVPGAPYEEVRTLAMTPDGAKVAFVANVTGMAGTNAAVYVWDGQTHVVACASVAINGSPAGGAWGPPVLDPSGRYAAFAGTGSGLVTNGLRNADHAYVRDLQAGATRLVDADRSGIGAGIYSRGDLCLTSDGGSAAFVSFGTNLVANDNSACSQVLARNLSVNGAELISARQPALGSHSPDGLSLLFSSSVSTNGRYVAFCSEADNLTANDTNGSRDVFLRDLTLGTTLLVSAALDGGVGSRFSSEPAISGDGSLVVFSSFATNLVAGDTNSAQDVFLRNVTAGTTELISVNTTGSYGNSASSTPAISTDGRYVLFYSYAQNLAGGTVSSGSKNLFLRDRTAHTTYALTLGGVTAASMTPSGSYLAFLGNLVAPTAPCLYVWDMVAAKRIYTNTTPASRVAISPDGQWVVTDNGLYKKGTSSWTSSTWSGSVDSGRNFSADGRSLVYLTSTALDVTDTNQLQDVYLYDLQSRTNLLISRAYNNRSAPNSISRSPAVSPDGRFVAYASLATNCAPEDLNQAQDLFLYDRSNHLTTLVSASYWGAWTANHYSDLPVFGGDGKTLFFFSWATDLVAGESHPSGRVFAFSLPNQPMVDSDGDGMDDQWELDHFGTLARDGTGDYDGDGASDLAEYLAGTDPTDPSSVFEVRITPAATAGTGPVLTWPADGSRAYRVQFKNNLAETNWQDLPAFVVREGPLGYVTDTNRNAASRFYRVQAGP
jgi:Tol biopolymer transport system component